MNKPDATRATLLATMIMGGRDLPEATRGYYLAALTPLLYQQGDVLIDLATALGIYKNPPLSMLVINWVFARLKDDEDACQTMIGLMIAGGIYKQAETAIDAAHQAVAMLNQKDKPTNKEFQNGHRQTIH